MGGALAKPARRPPALNPRLPGYNRPGEAMSGSAAPLCRRRITA
jgi:hypothetical protein